MQTFCAQNGYLYVLSLWDVMSRHTGCRCARHDACHFKPQPWPYRPSSVVAFHRGAMKSWKIVAIFLFQAIGLKYQEQDDPFCEGDLLSKTKVFQCDEQEEKMCQDKYTMVNPEMYTQCQLINGECLARGPPCKDLGISGLTCSSLSECEGKGWKKTWTSGTDTKFSKALGSWVLLGYVKDNGEMSHAWFFKTPESWKSTHPYKLQHKGDMIKAIRATDGKMYEGEPLGGC